ncbi:FHIPEP family type III secretion protein [Shigella flexneri]
MKLWPLPVGGNFAIGIVVFYSGHHQLYGYHQGAGRIAEVGARFVRDGMPVNRWRSTPTLTPGLSARMKRKTSC